MQVFLRDMDCGPCPYLDGREWKVQEFSSPSFPPALYEELLVQGFRRSGHAFYRNRCDACRNCVPIRLDAASYRPSKTLLRLDRLNADLEVSLSPAAFSEERFQLYRDYTQARHAKAGESAPSRQSYEAFLIESPLPTTMVADYRLPGGRLVATGYLDILERGLSSVYFAFDPGFSARSIGVWSVKRELELGASMGKPYYYLGFWVPGSPKMEYKARYRPFEFAGAGAWIRAENKKAAIAALGAA